MVVCVGAVVLKGEQALLIRQAEGHALEGQWSVPWGFVDPGETPEQAAVRETGEESGITVKVEGLLGFQNLPQTGWIGLVFLCRYVSGGLSVNGIETDRAGYFSHREIAEMEEDIEPWCAWVVRRVLTAQHILIPPQQENPYRPNTAFL